MLNDSEAMLVFRVQDGEFYMELHGMNNTTASEIADECAAVFSKWVANNGIKIADIPLHYTPVEGTA
jgi:hypothetical protein